MIGITEALPILLVIGIIFFFGKDKLIDWAKSFGKAKRVYDKASQEAEIVK